MNIAVQNTDPTKHDLAGQREQNSGCCRKPWQRLSKDQVGEIAGMYQDKIKTIAEIAAVFRITVAAVTYVAKRADLALRGQGCRPRQTPAPRVEAILRDAWKSQVGDTASRFGVSRQYVAQNCSRWGTWALAQWGPRQVTSTAPQKLPSHA